MRIFNRSPAFAGLFLFKKISIFAASFGLIIRGVKLNEKKQQLVYLFHERCIIVMIVE